MMNIVNYAIKICIILIGILLLFGVFTPKNGDTTFTNVMGVIFILFGIYRIILYRMKTQQYDFSPDSDNENENNDIDNQKKY